MTKTFSRQQLPIKTPRAARHNNSTPESSQHYVNDREVKIEDAGDLRKYRIELPNLLDDLGLSVYAFRLYAHLKRRAGDSGACTEGIRGMSKHCGMATGTTVKARRELIEAGLITTEEVITKTGRFDRITINNIWLKNFQHYAKRKREPG